MVQRWCESQCQIPEGEADATAMGSESLSEVYQLTSGEWVGWFNIKWIDEGTILVVV